jgi:hypothetical protein
MRRHRLLSFALAALVVSAFSPALAQAKPPSWAHGKGPAKPEAHDNGRPDKPSAKPAAKPAKPDKAPKASRLHLSGGGVTQKNAEFNAQGKRDKRGKGHFHYVSADGRLHIKCRGFATFDRVVYVTTGPPAVHVTDNDCEAKRQSLTGPPVRTRVLLDATFVDNGEPGTADRAEISVTNPDGTPVVSDSGVLKSGGIQVK